jgi:small basic protein (TIGR04137 family)
MNIIFVFHPNAKDKGRAMSIDKSLRRKNSLQRARNVLTRGERIKVLQNEERWQDGRSPFGLPKVRVVRIVVKKVKKAKEEEKPEGEAAAATEAAAAAPAAKGAVGKAPAAAKAPAGKAPAGKAPAGKAPAGKGKE